MPIKKLGEHQVSGGYINVFERQYYDLCLFERLIIMKSTEAEKHITTVNSLVLVPQNREYIVMWIYSLFNLPKEAS
jgi:hypothetical protein